MNTYICDALVKVLLKTPCNNCFFLFLTGDVRASEHPLLSIIHQLFIREHNKIAKQLVTINPHWSSDTIFYETRKIISAFIQCIIYSEVIPVTLSPFAINKHDLHGQVSEYDETIDATTAASFVGAAHRFGHSAVPERFVSKLYFFLLIYKKRYG